MNSLLISRFVFAVVLLGSNAATVLAVSVGTNVGSGCVTNYDSTHNYFPFAYNSSEPFALPVGQTIVNTALDFSVQYQKSYKLVRSNVSNVEFLLYQCGTPKPNINVSANAFIIPLTSVAIDQTIAVTFFELLGLLSSVSEATGDYTISEVTSACFQKLDNTKAITSLSANFSGAVVTSAPGASNNTNYINFDAAFDPGPLKRAEWIKYLALFFNKEAEAATIYGQIEGNYQCLNGSNVLPTKPTVAWLSFYGGAWRVSAAAYKFQLVKDAGGVNPAFSVDQMFNVSLPEQAAAFQKFLKTGGTLPLVQRVDVVIDESYAILPSAYTMTTFVTNLGGPITSNLTFAANKQVWRFDRRTNPAETGLDWFEGAVAQPQIVLQEMLGIVNPSFTHQHYFFRNVAKGEKVAPVYGSDCIDDPTAPLQPTIFTCPSKASITPTAVSSPSPSPSPSPFPFFPFPFPINHPKSSATGVVMPTTFVIIATLLAMLCLSFSA